MTKTKIIDEEMAERVAVSLEEWTQRIARIGGRRGAASPGMGFTAGYLAGWQTALTFIQERNKDSVTIPSAMAQEMLQSCPCHSGDDCGITAHTAVRTALLDATPVKT